MNQEYQENECYLFFFLFKTLKLLFFYFQVNRSRNSSLEIIKNPNKKRYSFESQSIVSSKKKPKKTKFLKNSEINYSANISVHFNQIKSKENFIGKVQDLFQNCWTAIHQTPKHCNVSEIEMLYFNLLKGTQKEYFIFLYGLFRFLCILKKKFVLIFEIEFTFQVAHSRKNGHKMKH